MPIPRALSLGGGLGALALILLPACRGTFSTPVLPAASDSFYGAWIEQRQGITLSASAEAAARRAAELDPAWAAPARFLDESVHRGALTLPERYGQYVSAAEDPTLPRELRARSSYLAGRLGGDVGGRRLERSAELDPALGWAWHGIGWRAFSSGNARKAIWAGERAVHFARDPHELTHFSSALARYFSSDERNVSAQKVLGGALTAPAPLGLRPGELAQLRAELSEFEMKSLAKAGVRRGVRRALDALHYPTLTLEERLSLIVALAGAPVRSGAVAREEIAYSALKGAEAVRASVIAPERAGGLVRLVDALLADEVAAFPAGGAGLSGVLSTGGGSAAGDQLVDAFAEPLGSRIALEAFEGWQVELPAAVRGADGDFVRPGLRELHSVLEVETLASQGLVTPSLESFERLAGALMHAGWFREARAFAEGVLATGSRRARQGWTPDEVSLDAAARQVQRDAIQARAVLAGIGALAQRIDAREAFVQAGAVGSSPFESLEGGQVESLRQLQGEIIQLFERYEAPWLATETVRSPVIKYGPLGQIVHPGPVFSAEDESQGRGTQGDPVPGIAALFGQMGRFALLGLGVGQGGPDATILRTVGVEERSGEHLGRPFRGTVFWCDGADVPGRFGRRGASISGAALHEGYYVDLSMVRLEQQRWGRLRERFDGQAPSIVAAITAEGARVPEAYRAEVSPALGAGDRMRLVVMGGGEGRGLQSMTLARLAHVVAVHEEGHLCDRASWYPLSFGRILKLISFAGAHGFKGGRIGQALEERAQLVALCACDDPRLAWIDLLDAAENAGGGAVTPHAAAYRLLLGDLLERLDSEVRRGTWVGVDLDPTMRWIDQLHRIPAEELRGLAIREAAQRF